MTDTKKREKERERERERESKNGAKRNLAKSLFFVFAGLAIITISLDIGMRSALKQDALFQLIRSTKHLVIKPQSTQANEVIKPQSTQANEVIKPQSTQANEAIDFNEFGQLTKYPNKEKRSKPEISDKTIVAFVFGQSNAANHADEKFVATTPNIYNYWNGHYYKAKDPLLGATGSAGSVWTLTANKLVKEQIADQVILIPAAVGGTSVAEWRIGGRLNKMLVQRLSEAKKNNVSVTHFLWHQGESDNPRGGIGLMTDYEAGMKEIISLTKKYFPKSKFYVALVSRCDYSRPPSATLQDVQKRLTSMSGVYLGPNTDEIGLEDRYDDCHFSGSGLEKHSDGWIKAIKSN